VASQFSPLTDKMKMDIAYFQSVEGSMTSEEGQTLMLHVRQPTGSDLMLG